MLKTIKKEGLPTIKKEKIMQYLLYADDNVDILKIVNYLAIYSNGALKLTHYAKNRAEWNVEE